jgi:hypothetical protein
VVGCLLVRQDLAYDSAMRSILGEAWQGLDQHEEVSYILQIVGEK